MKVLLYSALFWGHPVVYCRVLASLFLARGWRVTIASFGLRAYDFGNWGELQGFLGRDLAIRDLGGELSALPGRFQAEDLIALQKELDSDVTVLVHADYFREEFLRIGRREAPPLRGRSIGVFSYTAEWYPGEERESGRKIPWHGGNLRNTLGRVRRALLEPQSSASYFFQRVLIEGKAVAALLVKDERVSARFGPPVYLLPEIFKVFREPETTAGRNQYQEVTDSCSAFLESGAGRRALLYFGNAARYKGYDTFLALAAADEEVLAIHCGRGDLGDGPYDVDTAWLRRKLLAQGRLFERREFVESQALVEWLFSRMKHMVSTHRLTGTSGTVLQALDLCIPVLTPDTGLLGHRTRVNGLGATYRYGDLEDLVSKWRQFAREDPSRYAPAIRSFMAGYSELRLEQALFEAVNQPVQ